MPTSSERISDIKKFTATIDFDRDIDELAKSHHYTCRIRAGFDAQKFDLDYSGKNQGVELFSLNAQYLLGELRGGHTEDIIEAMSPKFVPAGEKYGIYALLHFRSRAPWHPTELIESLVDLGCVQQDPYGRISAPGVDVRAGGFRKLTAFRLDRKWRWYNRFLAVRA